MILMKRGVDWESMVKGCGEGQPREAAIVSP